MSEQLMFDELKGLAEHRTVPFAAQTDEFPFAPENTPPQVNSSKPEWVEEIPEPAELAIELADTKLTPIERVDTIIRQVGFLPGSSRELNLALGALENRESAGKFGRYLNEVLIHQRRSTSEDPQAALRKIVGELRGYAEQARANSGLTHSLISELDDPMMIVGGNLRSVGSTGAFDDWQHQGGVRRILRQAGRMQVLQRTLMSDEAQLVDLSQLPDDKETAELLSKTRVGEMDHILQTFAAMETARQSFWIETLRESRSHLVARPIANAALARLESSADTTMPHQS